LQCSNCWKWGRKKGEGSSATDSVTDVTDVTDLTDVTDVRKEEEGGRKKGKTPIPVSVTSVS
jgi:hypothetical protein